MTTSQFLEMWKTAKEVNPDSEDPRHMPEANFQKFPEQCIGTTNEGHVFGVHLSFEDRSEFYADYEICVFTLSMFEGEDFKTVIDRLKKSHGKYVYLVQMCANKTQAGTVYFYHNEARTMTYNCFIRKIEV